MFQCGSLCKRCDAWTFKRIHSTFNVICAWLNVNMECAVNHLKLDVLASSEKWFFFADI